MSAKKLVIAAAVASSLLTTGPAMAQAITNGSFETGNTAGWITTGSPFTLSGYSAAYDGTYFLWMGGYERATSIYQVVNGLTIGQTYSLSFLMASEYTHQDQVRASVNGSGTVFTAPSNGTNCCWTNWVAQSLTFTALTNSATIQFDTAGLNSGGYDVGVDKIALTAVDGVPEPATWAMMLMGFAGIGFGVRRSNKRRSSLLAQIA